MIFSVLIFRFKIFTSPWKTVKCQSVVPIFQLDRRWFHTLQPNFMNYIKRIWSEQCYGWNWANAMHYSKWADSKCTAVGLCIHIYVHTRCSLHKIISFAFFIFFQVVITFITVNLILFHTIRKTYDIFFYIFIYPPTLRYIF